MSLSCTLKDFEQCVRNHGHGEVECAPRARGRCYASLAQRGNKMARAALACLNGLDVLEKHEVKVLRFDASALAALANGPPKSRA